MSLQGRLASLITAIGTQFKLQRALDVEPVPFSRSGVLAVDVGTIPFGLDTNYEFVSVEVNVGTASAGAAVLVDINKNGTTIYSTQGNRPSVSAGATRATNSGRNTPNTTTFGAGDVITVDVDQTGTTTPGSNLGVVIRLRRLG
jgi:hypothetical protein